MTDGDDRRTQCVSGQLKVAEIRAMVLNSGTQQEEEVRWQRMVHRADGDDAERPSRTCLARTILPKPYGYKKKVGVLAYMMSDDLVY